MKDYTVEVLVNGKPVKQYIHNGKTFIEGRSGTEYSLKIHNNTYYRVLAIPAIDGVNVLTGKPASPSDSGYIVDAKSSIEIKGFRKDENTVGSFVFCSKDKAYSNDVGLENNSGVIGIIFFSEKTMADKFAEISIPWTKLPKQDYPPYQPTTPPYDTNKPIITYRNNTSDDGYRGDNYTTNVNYTGSKGINHNIKSFVRCCSTPKCSTSEVPDFNLGTTWGSKKQDSVQYVSFERKAKIDEVVIYYSTRKALEKIGIDFKPKQKVAQFPNAFPQFATPPKDWTG